jgi:DNA-binding transcriptional regulator LsrR (DeoR family)
MNRPFPQVNLSEEEYRLCVRVAKLYYEHELTQNEIGERLGYSRVKINRVLRQARQAGILEVRINAPSNFYFDLENALIEKFSLRDVLVVIDEAPGPALYSSLARGAASWLKQRLEPGLRIGLGLGRTISYLPQVFYCDRPVACIFTEVVGAASSHPDSFESYNVTSKMAELCGGKAEFFYAPTFVSDAELKGRLMREPSVIVALERARSAQIVIQSVGPVDRSALLFLHRYITESDLEELRRAGAVGDALGHYFDARGQHISYYTDEHVIGLDLQDLKQIPWSVVIAGGPEKMRPIEAAISGKLFNVLITDRRTALALLAEGENHAW